MNSERDYKIVHDKIIDGMNEGQMHTCIRDVGRLAGGMAAAGRLTQQDLSDLTEVVTGLSKNKRLGAVSWKQAVEYGRKQPLPKEDQFDVDAKDRPIGWDDPIHIKGGESKLKKAEVQLSAPEDQLCNPDAVESIELPPPADGWEKGDIVRYLGLMFQPEEFVGIVTDTFKPEESDRWLPKKGFFSKTCARLIKELEAEPVENVIGTVNLQAGAWIRINPLDGKDAKDANVTKFRHALIEADAQDLGKQLALIQEMKLPCTCIVHSGKKSIHALVKVDAATADEYRERVDRLYAVCKASGLKVDEANRNPSRLSRLPGVHRDGKPQYLISEKCGMESFVEWAAQFADRKESALPRIVSAAAFMAAPLPEPPQVIVGVLHRGSKAIFGGPSKAHKTWTLMDMCLAVATGGDWFGFTTTKGRVLYINLELQEFAVQRRLQAIAEARGCEIPAALHLWNLRGFASPMEALVRELIPQLKNEHYALIVPDPIYKTLNGVDENNAQEIASVCALLDRLALQTGAAIAFGAHFAKGNASGKDHIDRVSGSGVWARDPDTIITASRHEDEGAFSVEITARNFPQPKPFVVRWQYPQMQRDDSANPKRLKQARGGKAAPRPDLETLAAPALLLIGREPLKMPVFRARLHKIAETDARVRGIIAILTGNGELETADFRERGRHDVWIGTPEQIAGLKQKEINYGK